MKSNLKTKLKSNLKSNLKWYSLVIIVGILLITMIVLNVNQKNRIDDLEVKLDRVILDSQKANEEISKLSSANEKLQNEMDWVNAYNVDEMSQEIILNHRKISAISELLDVFSNINIFKGKVVSYTDSEAFVVEVELDKDDAKVLTNNANLWVTIPPDAVFYAVDTLGFTKIDSGQFSEVIKSDLSGAFEMFYPYSFVFVEDQLVQIYQGGFDLKNDY